VELLLAAAHELTSGFDQRVEGGAVQRLGVLFVAPHGPGAHQGGLCRTFFGHGDSPSIIVFVLDDLGGPAGVAPLAGFLDFLEFFGH
jgi:hypothetical protein